MSSNPPDLVSIRVTEPIRSLIAVYGVVRDLGAYKAADIIRSAVVTLAEEVCAYAYRGGRAENVENAKVQDAD